MGTLVQVLWDGQTDGTAATSPLLSGNTGFGVTSPSAISFSTSDGARGTSGLHFALASSGAAYVRYPLAGANNNMALSGVLRTPASNPSAFAPFLNLRSSSGRLATLGWSNTGRLYVADAASGGGTATFVSGAGVLAASTKYRFELGLTGGSATAGGITCKVYNPTDTSSPVATLTPITNANLGTAAFTTVEAGSTSATPVALDFGLDDLQFIDGSASEIGPILAQLATPVVTLGTTTNPATVGGTSGSQQVTWAAVSGASTYDAGLATNLSPAQSDFVVVATNVASPYTFTGLTAGNYSFAIRGNP